MRIFISIILFSLFMTACTNYKDKTQDNHINESSKRNICKIDSTFKLDYFKTMPKKFGFQGDYYTYDTTKISNDKYIFISDLTDIAVMKINGKDIYLKSDTLNDKPRINDLFQESWKGNGYEVLLKSKVVNDKDEEIDCVGTLEVKTEKYKRIFKIHGSTET